MAQKKINYELHTWTFVPYLLIILFIGLWYKDSAEGEPNLMAIVVGLSTIPIFMFLVVRLFALIDKKRKKEVILPRWRDLFCLCVGLCRGVRVLVLFHTCVLDCSSCSDGICLHFHAYKSLYCY